MEDRDFALVGDVVREILEKRELFPKTLYGAWEDIVGGETAKHSQPRRLVKGVLYVVVSDPVWKHHLEMNKQAIIDELKKLAPAKPIEDIRFRLGEIKQDAPRFEKSKKTAKKKTGKPKKRLRLRKLTDEDKKVLRKVSDVELRKRCRSLLKRVN